MEKLYGPSKDLQELIRVASAIDNSKSIAILDTESEFSILLHKVVKRQKPLCEQLAIKQPNFSAWYNGKKSYKIAEKVLNFIKSEEIPPTKKKVRFLIFCPEFDETKKRIFKSFEGKAFIFPTKYSLEHSPKRITKKVDSVTPELFEGIRIGELYYVEYYSAINAKLFDFEIIDNNGALASFDEIEELHTKVLHYYAQQVAQIDQPILWKHSRWTKEDRPVTNNVIYPDQERIGDALFSKIEKVIQSNTTHKFHSFEFMIVSPNRLAIHTQTMKRIKDKFGIEAAQNCIMVSTSSELGNRKEELLKKAKKNENTLYLIIHDECHWGIVENGMIDKFFTEFEKLPNIFMLLVSATIEDCMIPSTDLDSDHIVDWGQLLPESKYIGMNQLIDNGLKGLKNDAIVYFKQEYEHPTLLLDFNKKDSSWVAILKEYIKAIENNDSKDSITKHLIKEMLPNQQSPTGGLILIRLPTHAIAMIFWEFLRSARNKCNLKDSFEVLVDSSKKPLSESQIENPVYRNHVLDNGKEEFPDGITPLPFQLLMIPCILLVVEKARMGSTLPPNFIGFDLRMRYSRTAPTLSAFIQDVGRAFGYNKRPLVLMNQNGYEIANEIVTSSPEELCECYVLGNFTRRKRKAINDDEPEENDDEDDDDKDDDDCGLDINVLRKFFYAKKNMYETKSFSRKFLLRAKPQIGKTGAFISLIEKLRERYSGCPLCVEFKMMNNEWYEKTTEELQSYLQKKVGKEDYKKYHDLCKHVYYEHNNGYSQPFELAIDILESLYAKHADKGEQFNVADLGSGPLAPIATHFRNEGRYQFTNFDHVSGETENGIKVVQMNCASDMMASLPRTFDIAIISMSLMGNDYNNMLLQAHNILKKNGHLVIVEHSSHMPDANEFKDVMAKVGLDYQDHDFSIDKERYCETLQYYVFQRVNSVDLNASFPKRKLNAEV